MKKKADKKRIVEGDVSFEKLTELVNKDEESSVCEYKPGSRLKTKSCQEVRTVKALVSFANQNGGWVILGLGDKPGTDGRHHPIIGLDSDFPMDKPNDFDEEIISKVKKYLEDLVDLEIKAEIHTWSSDEEKEIKLGIIHINKSKVPIIFKKDGVLGNGHCEFRAGQYYHRFGKKNICAGTKKIGQVIESKVQEDWQNKQNEFLGIKNFVDQIKLSHQKQDEVLERLNDIAITLKSSIPVKSIPTPYLTDKTENILKELSTESTARKQGPAFDEKMIHFSNKDFEEIALNLISESDPFNFQRFLVQLKKYFIQRIIIIIDGASEDKIFQIRNENLNPIFDKITVLGMLAVHYDRTDHLKHLKTLLYDIFELTTIYKLPTITRSDHEFFSASWILGEVLRRLYIIGAYGIYGKKYSVVPILVKQNVEWDTSYWGKRYWVRFTTVMLAREGRYNGAKDFLKKIISEYIINDEYFFEMFKIKEDNVVNSACKFDFLQCLISVKANKDIGDCYPSFGAFYPNRIQPLILELINNRELRNEVVDLSDQELAEYLFKLDEVCQSQFFYNWDGYESTDIYNFIQNNYQPSQ